MNAKISKKDIAVIGISGAFPKSENIEELWRHLLNSEELIHFYSEEELKAKGIDPKEQKNRVYAESYMSSANKFDHSFFGFNSEEAYFMDPQIRKFFEHTWSAMEDAGYDITTLNERIGVFAAASDNLNWRAYTNLVQSKNINPFYLQQISNKNYVNTLLSYKLNLKGPSYTINTACSSSLVAVHVACRNLLLRECSVAIAGGVRITTTKDIGYEYEPGMIYSKDGHCKAFDSEATGTIVGEGVGVVVLKRLEDAVNDNDNIYAVIKASVTNNDGADKVGFTAPSVEGQYDCIKQAHNMAKITPSSLSFIEAHGTGTDLGDSIEIEALNKAFEFNTEKKCAIGSVKTNIGHLDAASGITGFIKGVLTIKNRTLPSSLHYKTPNTNINFDQGPFYVNTSNLTFDSDITLRGAVSSFGMGGTNAHVILEENPIERKIPNKKRYELVAFSAKTENALNEYEEKIKSFLDQETNNCISNIAFTFLTGRAQFDQREIFLLQDDKIIKKRTNVISNTIDKNIVFLFSGQGSQYAQMGIYLYDQEPFYTTIINEGFSIVQSITGEDLKEIMYGTGDLGTAIHNTKYTQPILFLLEYALAKTLMHWGIKPKVMIGHSLGEYVAACISGVFTFDQGMRLMINRGDLMNKADKGSMLSIQESIENTQDFLTDEIEISVVNTDRSFVISGSDEHIKNIQSKLKEQNINSILLATSHAFHSKAMDIVLDRFREELEHIEMKEPNIPFISNVTGEVITKEEAISPEYWVSHLRKTVRFAKGLDTLLKFDDSIFVEIGPGASLIGMLKQQSKAKKIEVKAFNTIKRAKESNDDDKLIVDLLGNLWLEGVPVNWEKYYEGKNHGKVSVPTYPFEKNEFPSKVDPWEKYNIKIDNNTEEVIPDTIAFPVIKREMTNEYVPPKTTIEKKLVELWEDFFKIDKVGVTDNFFELGGDSLQALVLVNKVNNEYNTTLSIENLYDTQSIEELSGLLNFSILQHQREETINRNNDEVVL